MRLSKHCVQVPLRKILGVYCHLSAKDGTTIRSIICFKCVLGEGGQDSATVHNFRQDVIAAIGRKHDTWTGCAVKNEMASKELSHRGSPARPDLGFYSER